MNLRSIVLAIFTKLGFKIYEIGKGNLYNLCPPYDYYTYSPWFEEWFQTIYGRVNHHTMVTADRCYVIREFCLHCLHLEGDFAECGVYKGGSAFLIAETLPNSSAKGRQLHLFDTFAGMPAIANQDPSNFKEGDLGDTSLGAVKEYLRGFPFVVFHPGVIPQTFDAVREKKFAFVHVDIDLYQTTMDCCNFFYNRMPSGGIMIFDDYGFFPFKDSEKRGVDQFFKDKPETPIALPTGQCIVIKV